MSKYVLVDELYRMIIKRPWLLLNRNGLKVIERRDTKVI
jgi:hypothetical protein